MLYLTQTQFNILFEILAAAERQPYILFIEHTIIADRNVLSENRFFIPNRYYHTLCNIEVVCLSVVLANYPNTSLENLYPNVNDALNSRRIGPVTKANFKEILYDLVDKDFIEEINHEFFFLNKTYIDKELMDIILKKDEEIYNTPSQNSSRQVYNP